MCLTRCSVQLLRLTITKPSLQTDYNDGEDEIEDGNAEQCLQGNTCTMFST